MPQSAWVLQVTLCITLWPHYTHLLMATSFRIMHHVTKLPNWFLEHDNVQDAHCTVHCNLLHSHRIQSRRLASWRYGWQLYSTCLMPSYQYGPKSLRTFSNTLLNLCHKELRGECEGGGWREQCLCLTAEGAASETSLISTGTAFQSFGVKLTNAASLIFFWLLLGTSKTKTKTNEQQQQQQQHKKKHSRKWSRCSWGHAGNRGTKSMVWGKPI